MKTIIVFDIPKTKTGKRLRMRILRKFAKGNIIKLQDSVWDITENRSILSDILNDIEELKNKIKKESKREPLVLLIKGNVERL